MRVNRIRTIIDGRSTDYQLALAQAVRSTRQFSQEQRKAAVSSRVLAYETRVLNRALQQQSRQLGALTLQWYQFRQALFTLGLRTVVTGFAAVVATIGSLAGGVVMLTQQVTMLGAALGTLGTAGLMGFTQGLVVATLGLKGIGKALTTVGKEHENALKKLTPAARAWVGELAPVREAFREIKALAQEGLFTGLTKATRNLVPLLQPVKQAVYDTARALGYLAERMSEVMAGRKNDIGAMLQRNVVTMRRMGDSAINIVRALTDVFRAADPFIGHVTSRMVTFTEKVADLAHEARADGTLGRFFKEVQSTWDQWLRILGNVGGTIFNTLKAASGPAKVMTDAIERTTAAWEKWTGSRAGQQNLTRFFYASERILGSIHKLMGAIVLSMGRLTIEGQGSAVRFFDLLRTKLLPTIERIAIMMDQGVFVHLMDVFAAILDFVNAALPGIEPMARALGLVAQAFRGMVEWGTALVDMLPKVDKGLGALAVTAAIIAGWGKLRLAVDLAVLSLRRYLGLTAEIAVARPGMAMFTGRGGRNQAAEGATGGGGGGSNAAWAYGGGSRVGPDGTRGPGRGPYSFNRSHFWSPRTSTWSGSYAADGTHMRGQRRSALVGGVPLNEGGGVGPSSMGRVYSVLPQPLGPTRKLYGAAANPRVAGPQRMVAIPDAPYIFLEGDRRRDRFRRRAAQRFRQVPVFPQGLPRTSWPGYGVPMPPVAPGMIRVGHDTPGGRPGTRWENYQSQYREPGIRPSGRRALAGLRHGLTPASADLMGGVKNATALGLEKGMSAAKPILKAGFAFAAFNGIMQGLGTEGNASNKLRNFFSGLTGGLIDSAEQVQGKNAQRIAPAIASNQLTLDKFVSKGQSEGTWNKVMAAARTAGAKTGRDGIDKPLNLKIAYDRGVALKLIEDLRKAGEVSDEAAGSMRKMVAAFKGVRARELWGDYKEIMSQVSHGWDNFAENGKKSLHSLRITIGQNANVIRNSLGTNSARGRKALVENFRMARDGVRQLMKDKVISVKTGLREIERLMRAELRALGWSPAQAAALRENGTLQSGSSRRPGGATAPQQAGASTGQRGLHKTLPGKPGKDTVPFLAAPGEDVAIFTRHQRRIVDQRLADMGGLPGLFRNVRTEHNKPAQFARGGMVTGDTDYSRQLGRALQAMAQATGTPISVQSGGRTIAEQAALYAKYKAGTGNLAAAPSKNAPHVRGIAADISPGQSVFGRVAARFGLGFTVPGEPWHIQLLNAAGITGGGGGVAKRLAKVLSGGAPSLLGSVGDAALETVHGVAQKIVDRAAEAAGASTGDAGVAPVIRGGKGWRRIGATTFGGSGDPGTGHVGYKGDDLNRLWASFAELNMGTAMGGLPYKQRIRVRVPKSGRSMLLYKRDIGAGGGPIDGVPRGLDIWHMAAQKLGLPGVWSGAVDWKPAARGILASASATLPGRNDGTPTVDTTPQSTPGKKKKGSSKSKKKPFAPHLDRPGVRALKRAQRRAKRPKPKKLTGMKGWLGLADTASWIDEQLTNVGYGPRRQNALETDFTRLDTMFGTHSNDYQAWVNSFDPGDPPEDQRVARLRALLAEMTGNSEGTAPMLGDDLLTSFARPEGSAGGILGVLLKQLGGESIGIKQMKAWRPTLSKQMEYLQAVFQAKLKVMRGYNDRMGKMTKGKPTWNEAVKHNEDSIKDEEDYLAQQRRRSVSSRLTARDKKDMQESRERIKALRKQNTRLRKNKPKTVGLSVEQKRRYSIYQLGKNRAQDFLEYIGGDNADNEGSLRNATTDSVYGGVRDRFQAVDAMRDQLQTSYIGHWGDYRNRLSGEVASLLADIKNKPDNSREDNSYLKDTIAQKNKELSISSSLFEVFKSFAPLMGMRSVGAFLHGGVVPETGMALVHRDETITPDPEGPFGTRAGGNVSVGGAQVQLMIGGELAPLIRLIDSRIDGKAPQVVNQEIGRRQRIARISPGRRS